VFSGSQAPGGVTPRLNWAASQQLLLLLLEEVDTAASLCTNDVDNYQNSCRL